jgi:hypothetical protein
MERTRRGEVSDLMPAGHAGCHQDIIATEAPGCGQQPTFANGARHVEVLDGVPE